MNTTVLMYNSTTTSTTSTTVLTSSPVDSQSTQPNADGFTIIFSFMGLIFLCLLYKRKIDS